MFTGMNNQHMKTTMNVKHNSFLKSTMEMFVVSLPPPTVHTRSENTAKAELKVKGPHVNDKGTAMRMKTLQI